jgi:hypothetical protein
MLKKVFVVSSFGGEWEDKWDQIECVFTNKERMLRWIEVHDAKLNYISDEEYGDIVDAVNKELYELECKYYDFQSNKFINGKTEDDWEKAYDEYEEHGKYEFIKEKFGYTKEEFSLKDDASRNGTVGYRLEEVDFDDTDEKEGQGDGNNT